MDVKYQRQVISAAANKISGQLSDSAAAANYSAEDRQHVVSGEGYLFSVSLIYKLFSKYLFFLMSAWIPFLAVVNDLNRRLCKDKNHEDGTGHVLTSQYKAWNDTVRMAMIIDLVWVPTKNKDLQNKMLVWIDNCGLHQTAAVKQLLKDAKIEVMFFPPNMTGYLQMLDLVVNGPIKNHLRNQRALVIYNAFQEHIKAYYEEHDKTDEEGRDEMRFRPPKPNMLVAIQQLFKLFADDGYFQTEDFKIVWVVLW